jgi:hypothetical protein
MARVSFVLTEEERRAFQDALGDVGRTQPLPPDALAVLAAAGLSPTVALTAGLMHQTITTGFDQPLEFDPSYHLETLGDGPADAPSPRPSTDAGRTFFFDTVPAVAGSVQFLLFLLAGPHRVGGPTPTHPLALRAAGRIAAAMEMATPSAPSHISSHAGG